MTRLFALATAFALAATPVLAASPRHGLPMSSEEGANAAIMKLDSAVPLTPFPQHSMVLCGQLPDGTSAPTIYFGPANVGDATGEAGEGASPAAAAGGAACNGLDNATEATVDAPAYANLAMRVTGMMCKAVADGGTTGAGTLGVTYTLRSAAADTTPAMSCTVDTAGIECRAIPSSVAAMPIIVPGATVAIKAVTGAEDLSAMDGWCRVFFTYF